MDDHIIVQLCNVMPPPYCSNSLPPWGGHGCSMQGIEKGLLMA